MAIKMRCNYCGKYINKGYVYTPWGGYYDDEPPDDKYVCDRCFTPERKDLLNKMWQPPIRWDLDYKW
jgi:hypothetical protein